MTKGRIEPPPDAFVRPLVELRDYYAQIVEEYQRLYTQARSQLTHVEALLSTWSTSDANNQLTTHDVTHEIRTLPEERLLSLPPQEEKRLSVSHDQIANIDLVESVESEFEDSDNLEPDNSPTAATQTKEYQAFTTFDESNYNSIKGADIPMLAEFHPLSRMEAIKQLLQEHVGTVCHIDFIVRSLYGDLQPYIFKVVKGRVQSSLTQGRERNAWFAIPDEPGCYTLDLALLRANANGSPRIIRPKKKKPLIMPKTRVVPMLREFDGQFLIDAITSLLEENSGKAFTVAEIISGLYGELDAQEVREVKSKVLNELSRGYRTGRFSRVPDKIGVYTWDSNLIGQKISG
ncbi:MAG: hypothetical protein KA716_13175 [Gloeotrichia echinulata DEX184]|nr:hypothetical protein [Gloeotrichia echinulata DEX184]